MNSKPDHFALLAVFLFPKRSVSRSLPFALVWLPHVSDSKELSLVVASE